MPIIAKVSYRIDCEIEGCIQKTEEFNFFNDAYKRMEWLKFTKIGDKYYCPNHSNSTVCIYRYQDGEQCGVTISPEERLCPTHKTMKGFCKKEGCHNSVYSADFTYCVDHIQEIIEDAERIP